MTERFCLQLWKVSLTYRDLIAPKEECGLHPWMTTECYVAVPGCFGGQAAMAERLAIEGVIGDFDEAMERWDPCVTSLEHLGTCHLWRPGQEWTPVAERMPPNDDLVLCHSPKWGYVLRFRDSMVDRDGDSAAPTHWMPLPEPPEPPEEPNDD